jgi:uncharacterized membrane protein
MKGYLSTGFIILLPIALTIWIILYVLDLFTAPLYEIVESLIILYEKQQNASVSSHETLINFLSRAIAFILTLFLVLLLGYLGRKYFFKSLLHFAGETMKKIPFIGMIYRLTKDVTKAMLSADGKTFKKTVLVPFPSDKTYTVGFVTGDVPEELRKIIPLAEKTVFIPTAPHPISGYVLFAPDKTIHDLSISTEETLKFLLTCGAAQPQVEKNA